MNINDRKVYDGYPKPELIAWAHLAAIERDRHEREEAAKRQILELELELELEEIDLHQPKDFTD